MRRAQRPERERHGEHADDDGRDEARDAGPERDLELGGREVVGLQVLLVGIEVRERQRPRQEAVVTLV